MRMKKNWATLFALVVAISLLLSGCGLVGQITGRVVGGVVGDVTQEVTHGVMDGVSGIVEGVVDQVMDEVFEGIIAGLDYDENTGRKELIIYDADGQELYTITDNEIIVRRVQNQVKKVLQWRRQIEVPSAAVLLYEYQLWEEELDSDLPPGERPLVNSAGGWLYEVGARYYFHVVIYGESDPLGDGWYIPAETAEDMIRFAEENAK